MLLIRVFAALFVALSAGAAMADETAPQAPVGSAVIPPDAVNQIKQAVIVCGTGAPDQCARIIDYINSVIVKPASQDTTK